MTTLKKKLSQTFYGVFERFVKPDEDCCAVDKPIALKVRTTRPRCYMQEAGCSSRFTQHPNSDVHSSENRLESIEKAA